MWEEPVIIENVDNPNIVESTVTKDFSMIHACCRGWCSPSCNPIYD